MVFYITDNKESLVFVSAYCKTLNITIDRKNFILIKDKNKLEDYMAYIQKGTRIKMLFSSENETTEQIKENIEKQLGSILFKKCKIFIFSDDKKCKNIDSLFEDVVVNKELWNICKEFVKKLNNINDSKYSILRTYLEYFDKDKDSRKIILEDKHFDFNHENLKPLKEFLLQ
ncbi:hypothetical protein L8T85_02165 [Campylobacter lari]|uniref:Uncharacterized protein n=1 Tax=Campylobacter lari TaxID=201 RepID=E5RM40_CAMLA|nr:hypothetical protein [Campylobacter lari]MCR8712027.1 hypothetical protein [Campylobacter sp. W0066.1]EAK9944319.1 hypothetical protein [Campylobacter lari]EAK9945419.1 hypothetical protein [Campylobacter lari]MCR6520388.1 hypothetical protein [Campylobacter lari]MCV3410813.1 hypothetical protein [Campylobacter lari]